MGKRQEAALETRRKIISAVHALLEEKSLNDISIEEITKRAGVAKGSFYTYFKRKEDAACCDTFERYDAVTQEALYAAGGVCQSLSAYLKGSAKIIDDCSLQSAQSWMRAVTFPADGEDQGVQKYRFDSGNIARLLERAVGRGELSPGTPVRELTELIMDAYYGAVAVWCLTGGKVQLTDGIGRFCAYGLEAILKQYETGGNEHENSSAK